MKFNFELDRDFSDELAMLLGVEWKYEELEHLYQTCGISVLRLEY